MLFIDREKPPEFPRDIIDRLPLERCRLETDQISGESGWHAPLGLAFRVTGQFSVGSDGPFNDGLATFRSWDFLMADDTFKGYLREAGGDREEAYARFMGEESDYPWNESHGYPLDEFVGKWLFIRGENQLILAEEADLEYLGNLGKRVVFEDVKGKNNLTEDSVGRTSDAYLYNQNFAELELGQSTVGLIAIDEEIELYVPRNVSSPVQAVKERRKVRMTSVEACNLLYGEGNYSEDVRLAIMRYERETGWPLSDDPLINLIIPTAMDIASRLRALYISIEPKPRSHIVFPGEEVIEDIEF